MTETQLLTDEQIDALNELDLRRAQLKQMVRLQACLQDFHAKLDDTKKELTETREQIDEHSTRLDRGHHKIANNSANVAIALKAAEVMLLKEATDRQLISTLDDVKEARVRIEQGVEQADTERPPDPDRATLTDNPRPTLPAEAPESETKG